ncbi:hypothetical protein KKB55_02200 [Myxococcota bacterium]|nr:hypothetical protein [Myxococcota bacterium]MBU1896565.1 hypothetical protein [Myxococcota bacterium]
MFDLRRAFLALLALAAPSLAAPSPAVMPLEQAVAEAEFVFIVGRERQAEVTKRLRVFEGERAFKRTRAFKRLRVLEVLKGKTGLAAAPSFVIGHDRHEQPLGLIQRGTRVDLLDAAAPLEDAARLGLEAAPCDTLPRALTGGLEGAARMILLARYDPRYEAFVAVAGAGLIDAAHAEEIRALLRSPAPAPP